jgi:hypothetical protein
MAGGHLPAPKLQAWGARRAILRETGDSFPTPSHTPPPRVADSRTTVRPRSFERAREMTTRQIAVRWRELHADAEDVPSAIPLKVRGRGAMRETATRGRRVRRAVRKESASSRRIAPRGLTPAISGWPRGRLPHGRTFLLARQIKKGAVSRPPTTPLLLIPSRRTLHVHPRVLLHRYTGSFVPNVSPGCKRGRKRGQGRSSCPGRGMESFAARPLCRR